VGCNVAMGFVMVFGCYDVLYDLSMLLCSC